MIVSNQNPNNVNHHIRYINEHKQAFDVEYFYPLDIFENFAEQIEDCTIECSCKLEQDKIYATRFNILFQDNYQQQFNSVLNFFRKVEARVDVKFDYQLIEQFLGNDFDFSKVLTIFTGIDLRNEFEDSRLKFWFIIKDYPEKVETAISIHGNSQDLRSLIFGNLLLVGFDFCFNGRSDIKLYPEIKRHEFELSNIQLQLGKLLSKPALELLKYSSALTVSLSRDKQEKTLHYHPLDPNEFIYNLRNDMANRVHNYYRNKSVNHVIVGFPERELITGSIKNLSLYYQMS
ncbi:LynF/TruF/PatF family peptide O-prenyltransferase [Nodularia sp. UHCC 0506]|uniref:LynF/TruF/PatF family peptide O-prenyltransferase n=1 Tax=Nodularia sp. UHCC 0506 TaxID=3110243 RepID=UPI002B20C9B2|nr:LynF/TruF/PatF family peptide O-prenyltransferase [Nodularia sp. UHCC 0506]MEA5517008.1 LynF/TruF/PatF family peptide O-prenyltransferase [Nodularia sp. UHCC 0506]